MPGSGKTYYGQRLAERLSWSFLDLDDFIETEEQRSIPEIFEQVGDQGFRELERFYLHRTFALEQTVIATGGGTPCFFNNMAEMKTQGFNIYLEVPIITLSERIKNDEVKRPLIVEQNPEELDAFLEAMLETRMEYYAQAHCVLDQSKHDFLQQLYSLGGQLG